MVDKPRVLFHTNSPWAGTGYGQQCGLFAPRLAEHFDLAISAFYGLEGGRLGFGDITIFPGLSSTYGNEVIEA
ncbi:MAG: hypothetical protein Q8R92_05365, partial [Deltaproteobacteria bacterium]|nr:hypothetical protein [Deltaproteobacteria bacterium]